MSSKTKSIQPGARDCLNCGELVETAYCQHCGQKNKSYKLNFKDLLSESLEELLEVDSRLFQTLRALYFKPGLLTVAYIQGKRIRHIAPLRLYLVASVIFFLLLSIKSAIPEIRNSNLLQEWQQTQDLEQTIENVIDSSSVMGSQEVEPETREEDDIIITLDGDSSAANLDAGNFWSLFQENLAKIMFLLLPVAALLLKLLYIRRRRLYIEHLIFSLHLHAFIFSLLVVTVFIDARLVWWLVSILSLVYLFVSMRRVYEQSRFKTSVKMGFLLVSYGLTVALAMTLALMLAAVLLFVDQAG